MTTSPPLRLSPRTGRVVLFFAGFFSVILLPNAGLWGVVLFGPPPYLFEASAFESRWLGQHRLPGAVEVSVARFDTPALAREAMSRADDAIQANVHQIMRDGRRYTRSDGTGAGMLLVFGDVLVQVEAPDEKAANDAAERLPFVRRNPSPAAHVMDSLIEHWRVSLAGLGAYLVFALVVMGRGGAWAARTLPAPGVPPVPADVLRQHLLAIAELDVPFRVRETRRGYLVAEWRIADAKWTAILEKGGLSVAHSVKMKLDDRAHIVRAIDVAKSLRWSAGVGSFAWSFSFFRGISFGGFDAAAEYGLVHTPGGWTIGPCYRYAYELRELKQPIVMAAVTSGWTWQPVLTFFRPIGG